MLTVSMAHHKSRVQTLSMREGRGTDKKNPNFQQSILVGHSLLGVRILILPASRSSEGLQGLEGIDTPEYGG